MQRSDQQLPSKMSLNDSALHSPSAHSHHVSAASPKSCRICFFAHFRLTLSYQVLTSDWLFRWRNTARRAARFPNTDHLLITSARILRSARPFSKRQGKGILVSLKPSVLAAAFSLSDCDSEWNCFCGQEVHSATGFLITLLHILLAPQWECRGSWTIAKGQIYLQLSHAPSP